VRSGQFLSTLAEHLIGGVATMSEARSLVPALCGFGYAFHEAGNRTFTDRQWLFRERDGRRTHHLLDGPDGTTLAADHGTSVVIGGQKQTRRNVQR